jgi:hypothetical protein
MAKRILSVGVALVVAAACQVDPIGIVDCRTTEDCLAGEVCSPSHACVDPNAPSMLAAGSGGNAGAPLGGTAGAPASGSGGVGASAVGTPLAWGDSGGLVASNPFGMRGSWFHADDCADVATAIGEGRFVCPPDPPTPSCCTAWDPLLVGPAPDRLPGLAVTPGTTADGLSRACLKGTVTQILNDTTGMLAYGVQWGAIVSLQFGGGDPFDTTRALPGGKIVGVSVDIDGPPTSLPLRVGYHTTTNEIYSVELYVPVQGAQVLFSEVELGDWVMPQEPFDARQVVDLSFNIAADPTTSIPIDFCVTNVRVLQEGELPSGK